MLATHTNHANHFKLWSARWPPCFEVYKRPPYSVSKHAPPWTYRWDKTPENRNLWSRMALPLLISTSLEEKQSDQHGTIIVPVLVARRFHPSYRPVTRASAVYRSRSLLSRYRHVTNWLWPTWVSRVWRNRLRQASKNVPSPLELLHKTQPSSTLHNVYYIHRQQ